MRTNKVFVQLCEMQIRRRKCEQVKSHDKLFKSESVDVQSANVEPEVESHRGANSR